MDKAALDNLVNPPMLGVPEDRMIERRSFDQIIKDNHEAMRRAAHAPTDRSLAEYYSEAE